MHLFDQFKRFIHARKKQGMRLECVLEFKEIIPSVTGNIKYTV